MNVKEKFENAGIRFNELDPEMIEILYVLNFKLNLKTQFSCYGHNKGEHTYVIFDSKEDEEKIMKLLIAIDSNLGTSKVKDVRLYKWSRIMYKPKFGKPWYPKTNWIMEIQYIAETMRKARLDEVVKALRKLDMNKSFDELAGN